MKIAHLPIQIAGAPSILAREHRRLGHEITVVDGYPTWLGYPADVRVDVNQRSAVWRAVVDLLAGRQDVVQAWFGMSLAPGYADLTIARHCGAHVSMHHCGSDIRRVEHALAYSKWARPKPTDPARIHAMLAQCSRIVDTAIVNEARHYRHVEGHYKRLRHIPFVVDVDAFPYAPTEHASRVPLVVHAPTDRSFKGTDHILAALERVRARGVPFRLDLVEGVPHEEARRRFALADVVVDQVCDGGIGAFAGEMMAAGKAVVAYLCPAWQATVPEPAPIASAEPDALDGVLVDLLTDSALRADLGHRAQRWIRRWHSPLAVAATMLDVWNGSTDHLGPWASLWRDAETGATHYTTEKP